jgi:hypothetical protein
MKGKDVARGSCYGQMGPFRRGFGRMMRPMASAAGFMPMVTTISENGLTTPRKAKDLMFIVTGLFMRDSGWKTNSMAMALKSGLTEHGMKVPTPRERKMA